MKRRVHTWLVVLAGALALPLVAACALALAPDFVADTLGRAGFAPPGAQHTAEAAPAPLTDPAAPMSDVALMSCADPELPAPSPAATLWCEDTESGSRCAPAAPERPAHDLSHASPALFARLPVIAAAPPCAVTLAHGFAPHLRPGRTAVLRLERPPRV